MRHSHQPSYLRLCQPWQDDVRPMALYRDDSFECPSIAPCDEGWDL